MWVNWKTKVSEISLGGRIIATKDFSWDLDVNWATNKNKLKSLYGGIKERMNDASNPLNAGWWVGKPRVRYIPIDMKVFGNGMMIGF